MVEPYKIERSVLIPKDKLHPNTWNPNRMDKRTTEALEESLTDYGQVQGLLVRPHPEIEDEFEIIDGEHRSRFLPDEVYCNVVYDLDDASAKKLTVIMDGTRGSFDEQALPQLLLELKKSQGKNLIRGLAYNPEDLEALLEDLDDDEGFDFQLPENLDIDEDALGETNTRCPSCGFEWKE